MLMSFFHDIFLDLSIIRFCWEHLLSFLFCNKTWKEKYQIKSQTYSFSISALILESNQRFFLVFLINHCKIVRECTRMNIICFLLLFDINTNIWWWYNCYYWIFFLKFEFIFNFNRCLHMRSETYTLVSIWENTF